MIKSLDESVKALAHTPQYKMHKYFARRPYNVFRNIIEKYTNEGDIIYDCFCGGGVTIFEAVRLKRKVIGVDLNPLATFITKTQIFTGDLNVLKQALNEFCEIIDEKYNKFYQYKNHTIEWTEWAYTVKCPLCGSIIKLSEDNKIKNGVYKCPNECCKGYNDGISRLECEPCRYVPIRVKYKNGNNNEISQENNFDEVNQHDDELKKIVENSKYDIDLPLNEMDRQREDRLFERGIKRYSDLFTKRNFAIISMIYDDIIAFKKKYESSIIDYIYLTFSSMLRYTNNMTRVTENWENGNPTSMDKHAYWFPNQFIETNVVEIFKDRVQNIIKGCKFSYDELGRQVVQGNNFEDLKKSDFIIFNQSSEKVELPDKSVNVVITDPPYGSNVQYAELSIVWNNWLKHYLGDTTVQDSFISKSEAVVNRRLNNEYKKTVKTYKDILTNIFTECNRVLKDDGVLTFTFNNKNMNVWLSMLVSVSNAGFTLADNGILFQDYIDSYKNTAHLKYAGNIQGDFIYTFVKKEKTDVTNVNSTSIVNFIDSHINSIIETNFEKNVTYTTTDIYTKVLYILTKNIMDNMCTININVDDKIDDDIIEKTLKKYAVWEDGKWLIK